MTIKFFLGSVAFLKEFMAAEMPAVSIIEPEGTYLVWLDFRSLGLDRDSLKRLMREKARVALDDGYMFGSPEGDGFMRINIACPRSILEQALRRINEAVRSM